MYRFKTQPFKHQLDCFERSKNKKFYALLMEMGTGKSKVLLDTAGYMFDQGFINGCLILANKGSYMNWATNEIPTHFVDHVPRWVVAWSSRMSKSQSVELLQFLTTPFDGLKIFLMNIEGLAYPRSADVAMKFVNTHRTLSVCDESTVIKSMEAKRSKQAHIIGHKAVAQRIMTGSVVDNRPLDAYSQFEFLAHGILGFTSYYSFRAHFAELSQMTSRTSPRPFKVVTGYKNLQDLQSRLSHHAFIIKKADCLDLPPKLYQTYTVEMTEEQERLYKELRKKCMTQIEGEMVTVKIVLTKLLRLHQIVCGHLKDDTGVCHPVPSNRVSTLMSILDETQGQVIIWANYREDIFDIQKAISDAYGPETILTYFGDTTDEERNRAKKVFFRGNNTEGVRFLVGNPATGGYGNNFTGANTHIYYSNDFDAEKRNQTEDRSHRIGQTASVLYIDLVAPGTVDEKILHALQKKKSLSKMITPSNWKEWF